MSTVCAPSAVVDVQPLPIDIVTRGSQLPTDFLYPSPDKTIVVGFDCEGVDLARHGRLCIMQLAWRDRVYLVDVIEGGPQLIEECRKGLESPHVIKVVHDCKRDSEALFFQFGVKLQGVFDTQIAYSLIESDANGSSRDIDHISFVHLLQDERFCGVNYDEKQEVRDIMREDFEFWVHRPWTAMMTRVASDDVRFLLQIHDKMKALLEKKAGSLRKLTILSSLACQCFCLGADDWPKPDLPAAENEDDEILAIVDIPPGRMGRIIGKKGASIRAIKEDCKMAYILTGGNKGPADKVFVIGPVKEVRKAEAIIRGKLM